MNMKLFAIALMSFTLLLSNAGEASTKMIVVDTGHSPNQAGSRSALGETEYSYNRRYSLVLVDALKRLGLSVWDVQANGQDQSLMQRVSNTQGAALFVSIHHDSIPQQWINQQREHEFSGYSLFLSGKTALPKESISCAFSIAKALQSIGEAPSRYHATPMPGENKPFLNEALGIHRYDNLVVLKASKAPAVLVEIGVIVNPSEATRLKQIKQIRQSAEQVALAIQACVSKPPKTPL